VQPDDSFVNLRSILSSVDFSEQSRHALRWAAAFAARCQSRLTVVSVVDPLLAEAARIRLGTDLATAETEPALRQFVATTLSGDTAASVRTDFRTPVGDPATAILETATALGADLIVLGTQGLGGWQKWLLGSTTERLLRRTHVPALAVPLANESQVADSDAGLVSQILAATDFSEPSVAAAKIAAHLALVFSARLTLAHIVEPLTVPSRWRPLIEESEEMRVGTARTKLKALAEQICGAQKCDEVVALGRAAELIGSIAGDRRAQLIVMGLASAHGAFVPRPGSIAYPVLRSTTIPVLVVPPRASGGQVDKS
jgi:nucleotide-binding universal stress UspA family protein